MPWENKIKTVKNQKHTHTWVSSVNTILCIIEIITIEWAIVAHSQYVMSIADQNIYSEWCILKIEINHI